MIHMDRFTQVLQNRKILLIGAGVVLIAIGAGVFLLRKPAVTSPLPFNSGVRVVFVTPDPNGIENIAPSPEASASASPKSTPKTSPKSSAAAMPKATSSVSPKASSSATPKASSSSSPSTSASPN